MPDEKHDEIVDDDDMPAPEGRCGDQFGSSQTIHVTDADA